MTATARGSADGEQRALRPAADANPRDVQLVLGELSESSWVRADPGLLDQVVLSLCLEAGDRAPAGGQIMLEVDRPVVGERLYMIKVKHADATDMGLTVSGSRSAAV